MEFFRHCPGCNRRFHIKLESKERLSLERETIRTPRVARTTGPVGIGATRYGGVGRTIPRIIVYEGEPIIIDVEEVQYDFKCKHCGHEWSEKRIEKHKES